MVVNLGYLVVLLLNVPQNLSLIDDQCMMQEKYTLVPYVRYTISSILITGSCSNLFIFKFVKLQIMRDTTSTVRTLGYNIRKTQMWFLGQIGRPNLKELPGALVGLQYLNKTYWYLPQYDFKIDEAYSTLFARKFKKVRSTPNAESPQQMVRYVVFIQY